MSGLFLLFNVYGAFKIIACLSLNTFITSLSEQLIAKRPNVSPLSIS